MADGPMFYAGNGGLTVGGDYDPGISEHVDRAIRNMPAVVAYCEQKARELLAATGSENFEVVVSKRAGQQRPRAYVVPKNDKGIHEELSQAVLLKAALGMQGK